MVLLPPRSTRLTHSFPTRLSADLVGVGQDGESLADKGFGGLEELGSVRHQVGLVTDHLELDPVGPERLPRQLGGQDRLAGAQATGGVGQHRDARSEEHTSELQSLMRISYAVFCLKQKTYTQ